MKKDFQGNAQWVSRVAAAIAATCLATSAAAQSLSFYNGNFLHPVCQTEGADLLCIGYVAGVLDAARMIPGARVCVPRRASVRQALGVVKKWMTEHPEERDKTAALLVLKAVTGAWPCK